ncbi:MAG: cell division control protein Cdc6, partial [Thermoplasmata archaeon]
NITTGEAYEVYKKLCKNLSIDHLTLRRISDIISELDILGILRTRVISRGRYGRTKEIKLEVPIDGIKIIIEDELRLKV